MGHENRFLFYAIFAGLSFVLFLNTLVNLGEEGKAAKVFTKLHMANMMKHLSSTPSAQENFRRMSSLADSEVGLQRSIVRLLLCSPSSTWQTWRSICPVHTVQMRTSASCSALLIQR
jgi:hypothetical protein